MISGELNKIIEAKLQNLPERLRGVLESDHIDTVIDDLASKYGLDTNLAARLDNCTTFVILGLTHPRDFIRSISETLGIDIQQASAIANEINERVFRPVREDLIRLYGINQETQTDQRAIHSTIAPPPPPRPKPLSAELEERAGLRPPPPPPPFAPRPRSIDAELAESMRKPAVPMPPPPPPVPHSRPAPSFVAPPQATAPIQPPSWQRNPPQTGGSDWQKKADPEAWQKSVTSQTPVRSNGFIATPQTPAPKPRVFENSFGESAPPEENLNRDDLLREIENPSEIRSKPMHPPPVTPEQPPRAYGADPYREPFN